jgi:hypothetical protein
MSSCTISAACVVLKTAPGLAPAGEFLSFAGPNERHQSKGPEHPISPRTRSGGHFSTVQGGRTGKRLFDALQIGVANKVRSDGGLLGRTHCRTVHRPSSTELFEPRGEFVAYGERAFASVWFDGRCPNAVRALFFGDFLLGQQKKVTRTPGRTPGAVAPDHRPATEWPR